MKKILLLIISVITVASLSLSSMIIKADVSYSYIRDLTDMPVVSGKLEDSTNRSKTGKVSFTKKGNNYEVRILHPNGTNYVLSSSSSNPIAISLPGLTGERELILESGVLFAGENGEQLIYYEMQNPASSNKTNVNIFEDKDITLNGFRPYVIWNFATGKFDVTDKLTTYAAFYAGTSRRAFVDILFNIDLDKLLMIELKWEYRYKKLIGGWTDYRVDSTVRYEDEKVVATNFWNEYKKLLKYDYVFHFKSSFNPERFNQQTIQDLGEVSSSYKYNYTEKINKKLFKQNKPSISTEDLFGNSYSLQRVYLNTYSDGLYTDYEISDDIVLVDIMYLYKGEYFHPRIEDIDWTSVGGKGSDAEDHITKNPVFKFFEDFNKFLKDKFKQYAPLVWAVIIITAIMLLLYVIKLIRGAFGRY